jgi:hypothetical protein
MTRQMETAAAITLMAMAVIACSLPMIAPSTPPAAATLGKLYTLAAQTLAAQAETGTPAPPNSPTAVRETLSAATSTRTPAAAIPCDAAAFVRDITVPDGTTIPPGGDFIKTWRLQNVGTCSWTTAYALVFVSGDRMHGPAAVNLPADVRAGQTVDVSVSLSAPTNNGEYQGYWRLRNASGTHFGIGAQAQGAFWVSIRVAGSTYTAYDFARKFCDAAWQNNNRDLPCPGSEGESKGYAVEIENVTLENGRSQGDPGLLTVPRDVYNGAISGQYPAIKIREGDHFQARVNCAHDARSCNVIFSLYYRIGAGDIQSLGHWNEVYEGNFYPIDLDLSTLAGNSVKFILSVTSNGAFDQDRAVWVGPQIARLGTPPNTDTPTASPTSTPSGTATASATFTSTSTSTPTSIPTETPTGTPTP